MRIDSLPGKKFIGNVSRKSGSEDPNTRLMHVEVDLPNPTGEIGDGMYGKVKILLDRFPKLLSIPLGCVVSTNSGKWGIRGKAATAGCTSREVRLGKDNGSRVTVLSGICVRKIRLCETQALWASPRGAGGRCAPRASRRRRRLSPEVGVTFSSRKRIL